MHLFTDNDTITETSEKKTTSDKRKIFFMLAFKASQFAFDFLKFLIFFYIAYKISV